MKKIFFLILPFLIISCKEKTNKVSYKKSNSLEREFPKVKKLSEYPNTEFVATLEHDISNTKNVIYASTMPYAWENIKNKLGSLTIEENAQELQILNSTNSHKNSLKPDEIELEIKLEGNYIFSKAYFKKTLPFVEKLVRYSSPLNFKGQKVENFGFHDWPFSFNTNIQDIFNILYYRSNNDFIFNLLSKDKQHEIIIYKDINIEGKNLSEILKQVYKKIEIGKNEKTKETNFEKYHYNQDFDTIKIPVYSFNIENQFSNLEKKHFKAKNVIYTTEVIYQRNAFIIDEYGAIVESVAVDSAAAVEEVKLLKPKLFILDNDFVIIAKRKDSKNPYFIILNRNGELMKKSKKNNVNN